MLQVRRFVNTPVTSNCFVVQDKAVSNECIIVDPGTKDNAELIAYILQQGLSPVYIILTHEHFDHCWGVNDLVERYHVPVICSALCGECIKHEKRNCSAFYENTEAFVIDTETISVESLNFVLQFVSDEIKFYKTLGHTDASISFTIGKCLFTGDSLIKDEKTVTKLPTGSLIKLKESLKLFLSMQGRGYYIFPGHGDAFILDNYCINKAIS